MRPPEDACEDLAEAIRRSRRPIWAAARAA